MKKYIGADGIRAVACFMVVFHHASQRIKLDLMPNWVQEIGKFMLTGSAGVSVFFVLSGFLLSIPFCEAYFEEKKFPNIKIYFARRAGRILPGFYLNLFICFFLGLFLIDNAPSLIWRYWSGLTFISGWHWLTLFPTEINGPLWSIGFEVVSYILMPIGMFILFKFNGKRNFMKALIIWITIWLITMLIHSFWNKYYPTNDLGKGWEFGLVGGAKLWMPNYNPIGFFGHFIFGILAAFLAVKYEKIQSLNKINNSKLFDIISFILLILWILLLYSRSGKSEFSLNLWNQPYYFPLFSGLTALLLLSITQSNYIGKLFDNSFAKLTAKLSFGIYIWHYLIMSLIPIYLEPKYIYMGMDSLYYWLGITFFVIIISYFIAAISWYKFEEPILKKIQSWNGEGFIKIVKMNKIKILLLIFLLFVIPGLFVIIRSDIFQLSKLYF